MSCIMSTRLPYGLSMGRVRREEELDSGVAKDMVANAWRTMVVMGLGCGWWVWEKKVVDTETESEWAGLDQSSRFW